VKRVARRARFMSDCHSLDADRHLYSRKDRRPVITGAVRPLPGLPADSFRMVIVIRFWCSVAEPKSGGVASDLRMGAAVESQACALSLDADGRFALRS
jgi:hypothetical protein